MNTTFSEDSLADLRRALPPLQQLAFVYAPKESALSWLGLMSLDARLAGIVRNSREPSLAQLRLAWWREQLTLLNGDQRKGDPLLAILTNWIGDRSALIALVDGWEAMTGPVPLPAEAMIHLAEGRAGAIAELSGGTENAFRMAKAWALADIAGRLSDPKEQEVARNLVEQVDWQSIPLPKAVSPLRVLHRVAKYGAQRGQFGVQINGFTVLRALLTGLITR